MTDAVYMENKYNFTYIGGDKTTIFQGYGEGI